MARGELACLFEAIALDDFDRRAGKPRHFPRMRGDDHVDAITPHQPIGFAGKGVQGIGVDHHGDAGPFEQTVDERNGAGVAPDARPDGDHVRVHFEQPIERGEVNTARRRLIERLGHVFGSQRGDDWNARTWRGDRDESGARAEGTERGQMCRTGTSERAGDNEHPAKVSLV